MYTSFPQSKSERTNERLLLQWFTGVLRTRATSRQALQAGPINIRIDSKSCCDPFNCVSYQPWKVIHFIPSLICSANIWNIFPFGWRWAAMSESHERHACDHYYSSLPNKKTNLQTSVLSIWLADAVAVVGVVVFLLLLTLRHGIIEIYQSHT